MCYLIIVTIIQYDDICSFRFVRQVQSSIVESFVFWSWSFGFSRYYSCFCCYKYK